MKLSDNLVFLDTETTGLTLDHDIWEAAWAVGGGPIHNRFLVHSLKNADPKALGLNGYYNRFDRRLVDPMSDLDLGLILGGKTLVGANPSFDAYRLEKRWGVAPWHYRLVDVESMAVSLFDLDKPLGLKGLVDMLRYRGYTIPESDHTAAGDVASVRQVYKALREIGRSYVGHQA